MRCVPVDRHRRLVSIAVAVVALALVSGCVSRDPYVEYDMSLYAVMKDPSEAEHQRHFEYLVSVVEWREQRDRKPPPGVCAECGLYAWKLGRTDEGRRWIEREVEHWPESKTFSGALERLLAGEEQLLGDDEAAGSEPVAGRTP